MGKSCQTRGQFFRDLGNISEARAEKIATFLRALYPDKTAEHVAADGIARIDTVRKWLDGTCAPSLIGYSRMISAYGPDFLLATFDAPLDWLARAAREETRLGLEARRAEIDRRLGEIEGAR